MVKMTVTKIAKCRIEKGLSVEDLAKKVGISRMSIYNYENGAYMPSPAVIGKIAEVLNCEIKDLID